MATAILCFVVSMVSLPVFAQDQRLQPGGSPGKPPILVTVTLVNRPFPEALAVIEMRIPYKFAYSSELVRGQKNISITAVNMPLDDFLRKLLQGTTLTWQLIGDQIVLQGSAASARVTLSGYIRDARTGESLVGASVYLPASGTGVVSNSFGFYSITVPAADSSVDVQVSYVGYKPMQQWMNATGDRTVSLSLEYNDDPITQLVVAKDRREDNVTRNQAAVVDLTTAMIEAAPSVSGTGDVISSLELLPGVQAGMDGTTGYYVRGGNAGQNLTLLDDATLYNPSHIFGLVGVFNPPVVKYASLLKGGFPASYGDHLSSVLDVVMRDGSNQQTGGNVQLGTISSGATLYGPLQTGQSSFLVSARRSTTDILLKPLLDSNYFANYYFYDVNAKLNFQLTPKDRLLLSLYSGRDNNTYVSDTASVSGIYYSMNYGNTALTARWNHQFSGKLFLHSVVEYDKYHQLLSATQLGYFAELYSGIRDIDVKSELNWYPAPAHTVSGGIDYLYQTVTPASLTGQAPRPDSSVSIVPSGIPTRTSGRFAVYAGDNMKLGSHWQLYAGVRAPLYRGPGVNYLSVEPRASLLYLIDPTTSVKVSYANMHQYIHLVQSYNASFPAEVWINSSATVRPENSQEVTAGVYKNFAANVFQTSLEVYYKQMGNQLLFGGQDSSINSSLESELVFGKGWSYGAELFIRKNRGRWTGWLAYTLAYAYERFDSLNEGQTFPFAYDRRNMLDLSTAYAITEHWKVAANFLVASGRAFSLSPDSSFILNPGNGRDPLYDNPGRGRGRGRNQRHTGSWDVVQNNYRLSPYNRLDFNVSYTKIRAVRGRKLETEWIFSVYNVYARPNNSLVYRTIDPAKGTVVAKQLPLIPVIPSVTYSLKF
ncbi:MAG TPA: TonB-dependent receptor [Puia sp.]|nr:TonB-dependent receptor [Puia sp.]